MQTQYRLLYRYMNPSTNTAITNEADFEPVTEFYTDDHEINITEENLTKDYKGYELKYIFDGETEIDAAAEIRNDGDAKREQLIVNNMANENKANNLYVYSGTKKVFHKRFVPEALGYKVRNWTQVPKEQIPESPEDFSKHFVMKGGTQLGVDHAYLVCKPQYMDQYKKIHTFVIRNTKTSLEDIDYKKNASYYSNHIYIENFREMINEQNWFEWINPFEDQELLYNESQIKMPVSPGLETNLSNGNAMLPVLHKPSNGAPTPYYWFFFSNEPFQHPGDNISLNPVSTYRISNSDTVTRTGISINDLYNLYGINQNKIRYASSIGFDKTNIIKDIIPAHYEETGKNPYYIKDTYRKIEQSPWMLHSVHKSLEHGLEVAKTLVAMLGINNVKLIKYVPVDQFIQIK